MKIFTAFALLFACFSFNAHACDRMYVGCPGNFEKMCPRDPNTCEWRCDLCGRASNNEPTTDSIAEMQADVIKAGIYLGPVKDNLNRWQCAAVSPSGTYYWAKHKEKVLAVYRALSFCPGDCQIGPCHQVE